MIEWFILVGDLGIYDILLESGISKISISIRSHQFPIVILGDLVEDRNLVQREIIHEIEGN